MEASGSRSEQLTTFFRYPEYIRAVGGQLTQYNVLDYFSKSDFYEPGCNNAVLQMQTAATNLPYPIAPPGGAESTGPNSAYGAALTAWERRNDPAAVEQELRRFVGVEYVLVHAKPPDLFVVHKRWRSSATHADVLDVYYILHGNVTMAADTYTVLGARLLSACSALQSSLSLARNAQSSFNPREGHAWRIAAEAEDEVDDDGESGDKENDLVDDLTMEDAVVVGEEPIAAIS